MDGSRRRFLQASGAGAVALSLAGCSGNDPEDDPGTTDENNDPSTVDVDPENIEPGGTFTYGMNTAPDSPNIMLSSNVYSQVALDLVYDYGVRSDPVTYEIKPWVFSDWEVQNEDSDQPDVYFNARTDGLEWNDGEAFTMEDVLFSYQWQLDNQPGEWLVWQDFESIEEASNDWDFHIVLNEPIGTWDSTILGGAPLIPKHKWEGVDWQSYDPMEANEEGPVGTGPGKLVQYNEDTSMQVVMRRDYVENTYSLNQLDWVKEHKSLIHGGPFIDKVNFKVFGEEAAMTQAMLRGDIDTHYGSINPDKIPDVKNTDSVSLVPGYDSGFSYVGFNVRRTPLDDASFRQAMAFMFDERFWIEQLMGNTLVKGDFAHSPGYKAARPETVFGGELLKDPATNAFDYRREDGRQPDIEGVRAFLENGEVVSTQGSYAGKEYPGSLSGVEASQSSARHEYTFGDVVTPSLQNTDADAEIRINGQTIPEIMDGDPITLLIDPPADQPKEAEALSNWAKNLRTLGIPIQTEPIAFGAMEGKVYINEDYDIYPMGWGGTSAYGTSIQAFFHSKNSGEDSDTFAYNSTGYGVAGGSADDLIDDAYTEMETEARNEKWATALERVYLDMPYMVMDYEDYQWPVNSGKFAGFVENITDPAFDTWRWQADSVYLKENLKE